MLDESVSSETLVWGIAVPTTAKGRRYWPNEIKALAAERVGAGSRIVDVAREIGANESLVAKWVRAEPKKPGPSFMELTLPGDAHVPLSATAVGTADLRIRFRDVEIAVPPGYPVAHLAEVLHAVRDSQ
ncbi:transposase [Pseudogemmobacter sonorensis]|uniref:transposase n=1 Tax=Pseudogemmobacter sonorensis TaxID=2989681 RepID=UPI0036985959